MNRFYALVVMLCGGLAFSGLSAESIGFRGDGAGLYPGATPPVHWTTNEGVVWKTALTNWSNASPILLGDRLFACAEPATLIAIDSKSGKILWERTAANLPASLPKAHKDNGYTSATPCTDGNRIWAVFGVGVVACWTIEGKALWSVMLETPPNGWGGCISPRLAGGKLVVQYDHMFGLDPATGAVQWKLKTGWGWGSPVVARIDGADVLYTCKGSVVDAATGKELGTGLSRLDYNSPSLVNGVLYYLQQHPQAYALPGKSSEMPRALWSTNVVIAGDRYYASPLVHEGLVYAINQARNLTVLNQKDGSLVYQKRIEYLKGTVYPSPTLAGNYIYLSSEGGQTVVIEPGREYKEVSCNSLEPFRSCPVFSGGRMFIRGLRHLWCIGK